jgi:hypothetical protein
MVEAVSIRILEKDNNRRGDLFGRLMGDLFFSLGYDDPRLNIARSGREIDIEAKHRLERRLAMAECKALRGKAGGKVINAFAGKLRAERRKHPGVTITPYFVSLSGFTETSVDQEDEAGDEAIILVDGPRIVAELIKGRILVPYEKATEQAGHCVAGHKGLALDAQGELLAHERGWVWAVYYTQGKQRTHVVLIHSDGTPLAASIAQDVIKADRSVRGSLHKLVCLNPAPAAVSDAAEQIAVALTQYHQYLAAECGYILLDGLPADAQAGSRRLQLENLFVPLHLTATQSEEAARTGMSDAETETSPSGKRRPVGDILAESPRVAILASPGGGNQPSSNAWPSPTRILTGDN